MNAVAGIDRKKKSPLPKTFVLQESLIVINPAMDRVHILNPHAKIVYEALVTGISRQEILSIIGDNNTSNREQLTEKIRSLLDYWEAEGILDKDGLVPPCSCQARQEGKNRLPDKGTTNHCDIYFQPHAEADFRIHDYIFRIRCEEAAVWEAILPLYAHIPATGTCKPETIFELVKDKDGQYCLVQEKRLLFQTDSLDQLVIALSGEVAELWQKNRDWMTIAHAAAIASDKACVLLPASGGSGKTTLTAALLKSGVTFLSDDIVPLCRNSGKAVAHPICLHIKQGSVALLQPLYPEISRLHAYEWGSTKLRYLPPPAFEQDEPDHNRHITAVVFPRYVKGAETRLTAISPTETFQQLIIADCMLGIPVDPEKIGELVSWVQGRPAYTLKYDSLDEAAEKVLQLL